MKKIFILFLFSCLLLPNLVRAEIPFGVTPKEITISGSVIPTEDEINLVGFLRSSGKITDDYVYAEGNRIGVKIGSIDYSINFWNVGKMGGTSGYLFWKKDYSKAVMYLDYNVSENGSVIGEGKEWKEMPGQPFWPMEPATNEPKIKQASCVMEFSGGPTGTFLGTCNDGSKISGRIMSGNSIIFDKIQRTTKKDEVELALIPVTGTALRLNGEFSDWKMDESGLVDSGTRFNSLSGQVEIRHDADKDGWKSAQLESIMYVDDHIKTGEESEAILSFADMSTFVMKQETEIVLNAPPSKENKLKLVTGKVMANIRKMMKDGSMEIDMSQAVAGIKGTRFILTEDGTESKIEVTEGVVAFKSKTSGQEVNVSAGESVVATISGLSEKTTFDATVADNELVKETSVTKSPSTNVESNKSNNTGKIIGFGVILFAIILGVIWKIKK
ncbi:MAG: FecR family protein [bacterium]|nr:FecR family protein [bacterium]